MGPELKQSVSEREYSMRNVLLSTKVYKLFPAVNQKENHEPENLHNTPPLTSAKRKLV